MLQQLRSQDVRLGAQRLILRAPEMRDAPSITACLKDFDVARMLARVPAPYRLKHARDWLAELPARRQSGQTHPFALTRRDDAAGFCIGLCSLERREDGLTHLGFWLGRPFWGAGLMSEAVTSVIRYGFTALDLREIHSGFFRDNYASRRIHQKMGFAVTGEDMKYCLARKADTPHVTVSLLRHEWREPAAPVRLAFPAS